MTNTMRFVNSRLRTLGYWWGISGVIGILAFAIYRLTPYAVEALSGGLTAWQISLLILWSVFMVASEGYDGFYKRLSPRILKRASLLKQQGTPLQLLLAPAYCLSYFSDTRRRVVIAYTVIGLIVVAVVIVHQLPQPWRGIIDCGVVLGLCGGVIAIIVRLFQGRQAK